MQTTVQRTVNGCVMFTLPQESRIRHYPFTGNCLENKGITINDKGVAVADVNATPQVGDVVICKKAGDQITSYVKEVERADETGYSVRSRYKDPEKDRSFKPSVINATVLKVTDPDGNVIWEKKEPHVPMSRCQECYEFYPQGSIHNCPFICDRIYKNRVIPVPVCIAQISKAYKETYGYGK